MSVSKAIYVCNAVMDHDRLLGQFEKTHLNKINMKNFLLTSILCLGFINATSQCTPDPIYQDSTYNIWPDTVTNMPIYNTSVINSNNPYNGELLIKTPTTIIEY